jgi:nitronate monooxygenase
VTALLEGLGVHLPVLAAPMAGGPGTAELVMAAGRAGSLGFVAAGYKTPEALAEQIAVVRASGGAFGVNVFAPNPVPVDPAAYQSYRDAIRPEADRYQVELPDRPQEDDDQWRAKIDLLVADPVPVVSFTFGLPSAGEVVALQRAGSIVIQTVTSVEEARQAAELGVDGLAVQSPAAGGHYGTLTPQRLSRPPVAMDLVELLRQVRSSVALPLIAAGGLAGPADIAGLLRAGAEGAMVGTALLLTDESGASAVHRSALTEPAPRRTTITRAFTGRPARALHNAFIERYDDAAPAGYPALHHLTSGLRRAATAAGDPERINLWAGTGYRSARPGPAADVLAALAAGL